MTLFSSTDTYVATRELSTAVNAAIQLQKPLLIKGEPGTGKTLLAFEIARALDKPLYTWHVKSTTSAQQGLYEYEAVSRLRDSQLGTDRVGDLANYIRKGKLREAFESDEQALLLIDEIDKADIEFPNDLLQELDRMKFYCYELQRTIAARHRPVVIVTSNNEKELPDAFLRQRSAAAVLFSLYPLSRSRHHAADRDGALSSPASRANGESNVCFLQPPRRKGAPQEAVHERADRLDSAPAGGGRDARRPQ